MTDVSDGMMELNDAFDSMAATALRVRDERDALEARVRELEQALRSIAGHMNADDDDSYRADDPKGAMNTVYSIATAALSVTDKAVKP